MIKKIALYFILFVIIAYLIIYWVVTALFYLSFSFIEEKTRSRFGDDFVYVYDQSKAEYGHVPADYVCVRTFGEIPKDALFDRVVRHKIGWTNWGSARRYASKWTYRTPFHFGVVDKKNNFYYWSYFVWDYSINPKTWLSSQILNHTEECRAKYLHD